VFLSLKEIFFNEREKYNGDIKRASHGSSNMVRRPAVAAQQESTSLRKKERRISPIPKGQITGSHSISKHLIRNPKNIALIIK